jgi:hypothetical protein
MRIAKTGSRKDAKAQRKTRKERLALNDFAASFASLREPFSFKDIHLNFKLAFCLPLNRVTPRIIYSFVCGRCYKNTERSLL